MELGLEEMFKLVGSQEKDSEQDRDVVSSILEDDCSGGWADVMVEHLPD